MRRRKTRTNAPPERPLVQRSLFEGEDVFVCPFCCEPLARVAGGGGYSIPFRRRVPIADSP